MRIPQIRLRRRGLAAVLAVGALLATACDGPANEGDYPARDVQLVVPYPAGSAIDTTARALAEVINDDREFGSRVQVVNREGGGGSVGTTSTLKAKPDGYTVGLVPDGPLTLLPHAEEVSYDPKSASVLSEVTTSPVMFVVPENSPYRTLGDLIKAAKAKPKQLTTGDGPLNYSIPAKQFEKLTGTQFKHVKFDGDQATVTALLGDNIDVGVMQLAGAVAQLKSGKVRALAIASAEPVDIAGDVPTFHSQDVDLEWEAYNVVIAPSGLPEAVQQKLTEAFERAVQSDKFAEASRKLGLVVSGKDGEAAKSRLTDKSAAAEDILKSVG